ncbi:hypothetical protein BY996DRAFT_4593230, partial [Phakopsora pachyrhizi]
VAFLLLDIGNPAVKAIPIGTRVLCGLLQSLSVRAAGFFVVSLAAVTPALRVQYIVMMYIAIFPIAILIRSTNFYEE